MQAPYRRGAIVPMSDHAGGVQLRQLDSVRDLDGGELPKLYGSPTGLNRVWLRANFIASLDGGATVGGTTGRMGGPGDRAVFNLLRELADVILVGAGTVRAEDYSGARLSIAQRQDRQARGQCEIPPLAIVTKSGRLDRDMPVFTRTEVPPLICTCTAACDETRQRLAGVAEVVDCSGDDPAEVDEAALLATLRSRGLRRILTEGGPMLLGSFIQRDLLDDLCLTIAPCV